MGKIVSKVRQARLDYQQRLGRDVSVQEVATAIGITRAALHKIETGESFVSRPVLEKLCEFYQLQPGDLLSYEEWLTQLIAAGSNDTTNWADAEASEMTPIITPVPALV